MSIAQPVSLQEATPRLVELVRSLDAEVMVQVSLDREGHVMDVEVLASHVAPKNGIPLHLLLERPLALEAGCVTYLSSNPSDRLEEADTDFTLRLLKEARRWRLGIVDHQLVGPTRVISVRAQTELW